MSAPVEGLVSVVIPVFNRARLVAEAVDSALAQSYPRLEIVLVDDASTDDTAEAIAALVAREPSRIRAAFQAENRGPGVCREAGRALARGEFLQFLDSDDLLLPRKFEAQVAALGGDPGAAIAYGWTRWRDLEGKSDDRPIRRTGERFDRLFPALLGGRIWITATPLYRAAICAEAGGWSELRRDEDWEFEARIGALGARLCFVEQFVAEHRAHRGSHAGVMDWKSPAHWQERARALQLILDCARRAGVPRSDPEMAQFARTLFLLARRCAGAGLPQEAATLFRLATDGSRGARAKGVDAHLLEGIATLLGWPLTARLVSRVEAWRGRLARST